MRRGEGIWWGWMGEEMGNGKWEMGNGGLGLGWMGFGKWGGWGEG